LKSLEELFASSDLNRLPEKYGGGPFFDGPLIGVARGDDPIFERYKQLVGPEHMTPAELWIASGLPDAPDLASRLRVLAILFPYVDRIREESKDIEVMPAEIYSVARNYANELIEDVMRQAVKFFEDQGYGAAAGALSPAFQVIAKGDPITFYSTWSERHMAFAAGLGAFSLREGFISEAGCNIRVASVVTDAPLEVTPRASDEPYANCLHYAKDTCRECVKRCPADAITEEGHNKLECWKYGRVVEEEMTKRIGESNLKPHYRNVNDTDTYSYPVGCAFCQFGVPCTAKNPMAATQRKGDAAE
jgi:epoxyqueuosine reductase QueG